jgi:hypothetical protein
MAAILTRAQSGNRCPANTNANVCLDEKEASELEREVEVEALNHLL